MISNIRLAACALALAGAATAAHAQAPAAAPAAGTPSYVSIVQETTVNVPAATAWNKIKAYCDIGKWLSAPCEITAGKDGELGALRKIAGRVEEVIVAVTPLSYTYADIKPNILYHGTVEVRPVNATSSKIVYSLFYDQQSIPEAQRQANYDQRKAMFGRVLNTAKAAAEAK